MQTKTTCIIGLITILSWCSPLYAAQNLMQYEQDIAHKNFVSAEKALLQLIAEQPRNTNLKFKLAQVRAWQGKYSASILVYDEILASAPNNSDYLMGKAQALHWAGKTGESITLLEKARHLNPGDQVIWQLELNYLQPDKTAAAQTRFDQLLKLAQTQFPAADWIKTFIATQAATDSAYSEIEFGGGYDVLDNGYDDWSSSKLRVEHRYASEKKLYAAVTTGQRLSLSDTEYLLGAYLVIHSQLDGTIEASYSPEHHVKPEQTLYIQLQHPLSSGTNLSASYKHADYTLTRTGTSSLGIEKYINSLRLSYTLYSARITSTSFNSNEHYTHLLAVDYFYGSRNKTGIRISDGDELEYDGISLPLISPVSSVTFLGQHWLNNDWAISYDLHYFQQGDFYTRTGTELGVRYRF